MGVDLMQAGRELDAVIAEKVMGFQRWRFARTLPVPPDYDGPEQENPESVCYALLTEDHARQYFSDWAFKNGHARLAEPGTKPAADALREVPCYSTDPRAAHWLLERAAQELGIFNIEVSSAIKGFVYEVRVVDQRDGQLQQVASVGADTFPLAICRAALAALPAPNKDTEGQTNA